MSGRFFSELAVLFVVLFTAVGIGAWYGNSLKTAFTQKDRKVLIAKPERGEQRLDPNVIVPAAGGEKAGAPPPAGRR